MADLRVPRALLRRRGESMSDSEQQALAEIRQDFKELRAEVAKLGETVRSTITNMLLDIKGVEGAMSVQVDLREDFKEFKSLSESKFSSIDERLAKMDLFVTQYTAQQALIKEQQQRKQSFWDSIWAKLIGALLLIIVTGGFSTFLTYSSMKP